VRECICVCVCVCVLERVCVCVWGRGGEHVCVRVYTPKMIVRPCNCNALGFRHITPLSWPRIGQGVNNDNKAAIAQAGGIPPLVAVLNSGEPGLGQEAAAKVPLCSSAFPSLSPILPSSQSCITHVK
jgi:hypothetical protein